MSLTNPKTVVTEERLSAFYQKLLPYLGGMPEMLANKFSKGDLYSADEHMIGQWIDGKPLYQKVYTNVTLHDADQSRHWITILGSNDLPANIDDIHMIESLPGVIMINWYNGVAAGIMSQVYYDKTLNSLRALVGGNSWISADDGYLLKNIIIKYTKTTDSAIVIGSDTDYSTEEKIVGTWIDGRPVYQKTINFGGLPNATSKSVAHGISNLDFVTSIEAVAKSTQDIFMSLPLCYESGNTGNNTSIQVNQTSVKLTTNSDRSVYTNSYITLRYIKTS